MDRDNWQRIEEIFYAVVETPAGRQQQVLEEAAKGDPEIIQAVKKLLDADQRQNDTIPRAIRGMVTSMTEPLDVGQRIGAYEVEREIGHGGMGTVYLATRADDEFHKRVAIKLLRRGMENPDLVNRFRQERQILAALDHPYIARLIDGGATEDGRPYLIMDYAEGPPATTYCEQRKLPWNERLQIFQKVCEAVAHAHRNLVVHRDLKPGNILVMEDGTPKLLDFGIAKLLDPAIPAHETGATMGLLTPDYASPEQVRGEKITTASDVYSLGAVLFELLTGKTAYSFANYSPQEVLRVVSEEEPAAGLLPGDLDSIVRKAMRKEPRDRYASVDALREDIARYLEGRPVSARGPSVVYQAGMFLRRHWIAATAVVIAIGSLAGTAVYAMRQAQRAERRFAQVRQLSNKFLFDFHDSIAELSGSTKARQQVVRTALEYLNSLANEATGDVSLLSELATAYERVGDVQGNAYFANLGDTQGAMESYRRAMQLRLQMASLGRTPMIYTHDLMQSYSKLADVNEAIGRNAEAEKLQNDGLALYSKINTPNQQELEAAARLHLHRGDVRDKQGKLREALTDYHAAARLLDRSPVDPKHMDLLATANRRLGERLPATGDRAQAYERLRTSLEMMEHVVRQEPSNSVYQRNLMTSRMALGSLQLQDDRFDEALQQFDRSREMAELLAKADTRNVRARSDLAAAYSRIGDAHAFRKKHREALPHYQHALAAAEEAARMDSGNLRYQRDVAYYTLNIGNAAAELPDYQQAIRWLEQGSKLVEDLIRRDSSDQDNYWLQAQAYRDLAGVNALMRDWKSALANNRKALEVLDHAPAFRRHSGPVCQQMGEAHEALSQWKEALEWWQRAKRIHEESAAVEGDNASRREELRRIDRHIVLALHNAK